MKGNSNSFLFLLGFIGFGLVFVCITVQADTNDTVVEPLISSGNVSVSQGKVKRTCACDETAVETPICASNGVTYKSTCRFDCAKARVTRLRKVKNGPCTKSTGPGSYWQG